MILVAGGTGHLGGALLELLADAGHQVRLLTRKPEQTRPLASRGEKVVAGDVRDPASLVSALAGVESVISAVTGFGPGGPGPRTVDFQGNENLIAAAEEAGAKRFVLVSIRGAGPDHAMELNRMKFLAEQRLRKSPLDWTILRPTVFMELWAGIIGGSGTDQSKGTVFGRGDNPINFVSVRDVGRFIVLSLNDPRLRRSALDVGGPENLTATEVVAILESVRGRKLAVRHVPLPAIRAGAQLMRYIRPQVAAMLQAGVLMATSAMSFDPHDLRARYPDVALTPLRRAVESMPDPFADPRGMPTAVISRVPTKINQMGVANEGSGTRQ